MNLIAIKSNYKSTILKEQLYNHKDLEDNINIKRSNKKISGKMKRQTEETV